MSCELGSCASQDEFVRSIVPTANDSCEFCSNGWSQPLVNLLQILVW
jgi:hypothetical protein